MQTTGFESEIRVEDEDEDYTDEDYFSNYVMLFTYGSDYWSAGIG